MEENNLKELWQTTHVDAEYKTINIREVIRKRHCAVISRTLHKKKMLIVILAIVLTIDLATFTFHMYIMGKVSSSLTSLIFILCLLFSSIRHYRLLTKSADMHSVKDSAILLKKQLIRAINIDFIIYLIFFYGNAIRFTLIYFNDREELKELSFLVLLITVIFICIPWIIKYIQKQRYRYYFNSLDKSTRQLEVSE